MAPDDAQKILLDVELSPENNHAKFLYDYIDGNRYKKCLSLSPKTDKDFIENLAILHRRTADLNSMKA
ncbi:hypothetical protein XIS1_940013 [Xenorhabdus innexi]|uniref:Uncharacterized protein n=1 Tax=Xenorhabdus innexi TaxID=290109 RepID=A0A1N6N268_9GAMM|nr:hypothetical protein XIS1_940013 [Xenorhabdus innexi]